MTDYQFWCKVRDHLLTIRRSDTYYYGLCEYIEPPAVCWPADLGWALSDDVFARWRRKEQLDTFCPWSGKLGFWWDAPGNGHRYKKNHQARLTAVEFLMAMTAPE